MRLTQTSTSFDEPISVEELRQHLRIEDNDEDSYLLMLIGSARALAENYIDGIIADREYLLTLDGFSSSITLPLRPVDPDSITITYFDEAGDSQTIAEYEYKSDSFKTIVFPAYNESWPITEAGFNKVTITLTAGLAGAEGSMPLDVKHALLMIAGTLYDQREDHTAQVRLHDVPTSSQMLLDGYKKVIL